MPDHPTDEALLSQLEDIQANVVRGHPWKHARYHFLKVEDPARFRQALAAALAARPLPSAKDFRPDGSKPDRALNVAFTHPGLRALGVAQPFLERFPEDFREGMAARAERLGDGGESAPENWDRWLGTPEVHVLVALFFEDRTDFEAVWRDFATAGGAAPGDGVGEPGLAGSRHLLTEKGDQLFDEKGAVREHFGFRDGVSQPALADGLTSPKGSGWVDEHDHWQPVATGEFLLGHGDTDGFDPLAGEPALRELCRNGTYLVFRKLRQHVEGFQKFLAENYEPALREKAAARMVGRWKNGTPLVLKPNEPDSTISSSTPNDFVYAGDADGQHCPFSAHIRRVNPRDVHRDRSTDSRAVARRRIIRRGFAYGRPEDAEKGLLFVCFSSRIDSQFEFLQEEWINRGDFIGEGSRVRDPLVGAHDEQGDAVLLPTGQPRYASIPRFVTTRGGDYFFLPGLSALRALLEGRYGADSATPPPAPTPSRATDPVRHPEHLDVARLHQTREVETLWVDGVGLDGARRARRWHYVVGYDQVLEVLDDESRFTVDHNTLRLYELLCDPDRNDQQEFEKQMLLGLPGGHPEKERRYEILRNALGAPAALAPIPGLFDGVSPQFEDAAYQVTKEVIRLRGVQYLDVARHLTRTVPIQRVLRFYGVALPDAISELQKAWHFRQLLEPDRAWLARARQRLEAEGKGRSTGLVRGLRFEGLGWTFPDPGPPAGVRELSFLSFYAAVELLIDAYDTGELFDIGRLAIRDLLKRVDEAVANGAPPNTLLAALLARAPAGAERGDYLTRVKLLLLELIVGGIETPAKGITNAVDGLLSHPEAMQAARQAAADRDAAALDAVIHELLRLDPVAFLLFRECPEGATLASAGGHEIAPGSRVVCVLRHAYRDPRAFPDEPATFRADRGRRADDPSFGRAPHECIGERIAMAEIRGVVRALLDGHELQRVPGRAGTRQERFRLPMGLGIKRFPIR